MLQLLLSDRSLAHDAQTLLDSLLPETLEIGSPRSEEALEATDARITEATLGPEANQRGRSYSGGLSLHPAAQASHMGAWGGRIRAKSASALLSNA